MKLYKLQATIIAAILFIVLIDLKAQEGNKDVRQPRENGFNIHQLECAKDIDLDEVNESLCMIKNQNEDIKDCLEDHDEAVEEDFERVCSKIEALDQNVSNVEVLLCEKIESTSDVFLSELDVTENVLCSKIELLNDSMGETENDCSALQTQIINLETSLCEKIESTSDVFLSELDTTESILCLKIENLDQNVSNVELSLCEKIESTSDLFLSELDVTENVLCSKIESLDQNVSDVESSLCEKIESTSDLFLSELDVTESILCNKIEVLDVSSCCDVLITQDMMPFTTTAAGLVYCLAESVTIGEDETAITVAHDNVVIDLCGHTIDAEATNNSIGISASGRDKLTIKNGNVCGTDLFAIQVVNSSNIFVLDIQMAPADGRGFTATNSTSGKLRCCRNNGGELGFLFESGTSGFMVFDCLELNSGYVVSESSDICMFTCKSVNATNSGFGATTSSSGFLVISSSEVVLSSCIALESGDDGFLVFGETEGESDCITLKGCIAKNCGASGFLITNDVFNLTIRNCIANCNQLDGFSISSTVSTGELVGCTAIGNTSDGVSNGSSTFGVFNTHARDNGAADFTGAGLIAPDTAGSLVDTMTAYWSNVSS